MSENILMENENGNSILQVFNKLYEIGFSGKISLPKIVLIGDQSTGKSSVVESLSGINLPRGTDMVTRAPIIVSMFQNDRNYIMFEEKEVQNEELNDLILRKQVELSGDQKGITTTPINIKIYGPELFDLTIIDLPGLVMNAVEGQPEDIKDQIDGLVMQYIKDPQSIMLLVLPADMDVATVQAIRLAKEHDPKGERTIGIITKTDRAQIKEDIIDLLEMKKVKFHLGVFATRNRNPKELEKGITLQEARELEKRFFQRNYPDHRHICGMGVIASKLSSLLRYRIADYFPKLQKDLESKIAETMKEIDAFGICIPENQFQKRLLMISMMEEISKEIQKKLTIGESSGIDFCEEKEGKEILVKVVDDWFVKYGNEVRKNIRDYTSTVYQSGLKEFIQKEKKGLLKGFLPFGVFKAVIKERIEELRKPSFQLIQNIESSVRKEINSILKEKMKKYPIVLNQLFAEMNSLISKLVKETQDDVNDCFEKELEYMFTNNHYYSETINKLNEKEFKKKVNENSRETTYYDDGRSERMMNDNVKDSKSLEENESIQMSFRLLSYHKVFAKRVMDNIPMTIRYRFLSELKKTCFKHLMETSTRERVLKEFREPSFVMNKRKDLKNDLTKYKEGLNVLKDSK